jgi:hypothetical protein
MLVFLLAALPGTSAGQESVHWLPIDAEDLKLKDNPKEPGGSAMVLDLWDEVDNPHSTESVRVRLKVLRDDGRKYANIEIPYAEKYMQVEDVRARTVASDGQSTDFAGAIYDTEVVKAKRFKLSAKTLALPDVQTGSIIEYTYRLHWKRGFPDAIKHYSSRYPFTDPVAYPAANWDVQRDVFVRHAVLTLHPFSGGNLQFNFVGLGAANAPPFERQADGSIRLELRNLPAFTEEEAAPPEANLRAHVGVYYTYGFADPQYFWRSQGKESAEAVANFFKKSSQARNEVRRLILPSDTNEQKLRKLYARAQQIRMISYGEAKTEQELKREDIKENKNVDEVLSRNYGFSNEVNLVFVALAREAGFQAHPVQVASRGQQLFQPKMYDPAQLNAMVVEVLLDGTVRYFDPATLYCPFDALPWPETDTVGVLVDAVSPTVVTIPARPSAEAIVRRKAELRLDAEGNLEGDIEVSFEGQEALIWRLEARNEDEAHRRKRLEDWMMTALPPNSESKLIASDGWGKPEGFVTATFHVQTHAFANLIGQRLLLPISFFPSADKNGVFSAAKRTNPIYFRYSTESRDDVRFVPPEQFRIEAVPDSQSAHHGVVQLDLRVKSEEKDIRVTRAIVLNGTYFPSEEYSALRDFYQLADRVGEQQVVLRQIEGDKTKSH